MTSRIPRWERFLSRGGFPERGTGRPDAVAIAELAFSMSGPELPSLSQTVLPFLASHSDETAVMTRVYSGRAAILSRERPGAFLVPSHPPLVSSWTYGLALPPPGRDPAADEVGLSPVNVVSHCVQAIPPATLLVPMP